MSGGRWVPEIDGLRFLAIGWVVFYHIYGYVATASGGGHDGPFDVWLYRVTIGAGAVGVPLFFAISGFVLALPFLEQRAYGGDRVGLRRYLWRRVTRLEPPYVISLLAIFALLYATGEPRTFSSLGWSLLYLHNLRYGNPSDVNGVAWSLEVEIQFYLLAPFLAAVFSLRRGRRGLLAAAVVGWAILVPAAGWSKLTLLGNLQYFLVGFLVADLYRAGDLDRDHHGVWDMAGLVLLAMMGIAFRTPGARPLVAVIILGFVVSVFRGPRLRAFFTQPFVFTVGGMCYSIYLIHTQVRALVGRAMRDWVIADSFLLTLAVQAVPMAVAVLLTSAVFFLVVERPCMNPGWPAALVRRLTGRQRARLP